MTVYFIDYDRGTGRVTSWGSVTQEAAPAHFASFPYHVEIDAPLPGFASVKVVQGALAWSAPQPADQDVRTRLRMALADSDRTQVADYPIDDAERAAWRTYRQQLRDRLARPPGADLLSDLPDDPTGGNVARDAGFLDLAPPAGLVLPKIITRQAATPALPSP